MDELLDFAALMCGRDPLTATERLELERPAWHAEAACRGRSDLNWISYEGTAKRCLAVCRGCPVREECLAFALRTSAVGTWGGMTGEERARIRGISETP